MSNLWVDPAEDPRTFGNPQGELATYREYLTNFRQTLRMKCDGLSPEQLATRSVPPSTLSLLGLVRHMAKVEHSWFQRVLRQQMELPRLYRPDDEPDHDFDAAVGTQECADDAFTTWSAQVGGADAWLDDLDEGDLGRMVRFDDESSSSTLSRSTPASGGTPTCSVSASTAVPASDARPGSRRTRLVRILATPTGPAGERSGTPRI